MACDLMMPQPSVCVIPTPWVMTHVCQSPYVHNFIMHNGSPHVQIFLPIWGLCVMLSPYAYGDLDQSPYAYGGIKDPRMRTGIA